MTLRTIWACLLWIGTIGLVAPPVFAQQVPDAGTLLRETERSISPPTMPTPAPQVIPEAPVKPDGRRVQVQRFRITGASLFSEAELLDHVGSFVGRELTFAELQQVADSIATYYRKRGRFARVYLPEQDIRDGVVTIAVVEGRLGKIRLDGGGKTFRLKPDVAEGYLWEGQKQGELLRLDELERAVRVLNDLPGVSTAAILEPGTQSGEIEVIARIQDKPMTSGSLQVDNHGVRSTGYERLTGSFSLSNLSGRGDQAGFNVSFTHGLQYGRVTYQLPVGRQGLQVGVSTSSLSYLLGEEFSALSARGSAASNGLNATYPLILGRTYNLSMFAGIERRDYHNESAGVATSDKDIRALTVGVNGDITDGFGGGGFTLWGVSLVSGRANLADNASDYSTDQAGPRRHGRYHKLAWNIGRVQKLSAQNALWLSLSGQFSDQNLESSEDMSLGGPSGVRAYPVSEASGDEGVLLTAELRHSLRPELQLVAFYDAGRVTLHKKTWADWNSSNSSLPNRYSLDGAGVGVAWAKPGHFAVRFNAAKRLGFNPGRDTGGKDSDGTLKNYRFWLSAIKFF